MVPWGIVKVLIIEDDPLDAQQLVSVLRGIGVADGVTVAASNARVFENLERIVSEGRSGELKLIFLDLHGPQLDGLALLEQLKADSR